MKRFCFVPVLAFVLGAIIAWPCVAGAATAYPEKSIQLIIPYGPGGGNDILSRAIDSFAPEVFGHNFVFTYKPGAGSAIGVTALAKEKNDGYTIGMGLMPHMVLQPASGSGRYSLDSFDYIAIMVAEPQLFVTPKGSAIRTFADFMAAARQQGSKMTLGIPSALSECWMAYQRLAKETGLGCTVVTYAGGAACNAALFGNQVDSGCVNVSAIFGEIDKVNVLAVTSEERLAMLPDVPTLRELGIDVVNFTDRIYMAPKGIDPEQLKVLREGFKKIWHNPVFQKRCEDLRITTKLIEGEHVRAYLDEQAKSIMPIFEATQKE